MLRQDVGTIKGPPGTTRVQVADIPTHLHHADGLARMAPVEPGQSGVHAFLEAAGLATAPQTHT
jgi:hypothetical protein